MRTLLLSTIGMVYLFFRVYQYYCVLHGARHMHFHLPDWSSCAQMCTSLPIIGPDVQCRFPHGISLQFEVLHTPPACTYTVEWMQGHEEEVLHGWTFHPALHLYGTTSTISRLFTQLVGIVYTYSIDLCQRCTQPCRVPTRVRLHKPSATCPWPIMVNLRLVYTPSFDRGIYGMLYHYPYTGPLTVLLLTTLYVLYISSIILTYTMTTSVQSLVRRAKRTIRT